MDLSLVFVVIAVLVSFCKHGSCYYALSSLNAVVFTHIEDPEPDVHSEYYFGKCATQYKTLFRHLRFTYKDLKGVMVHRAWIAFSHTNSPDETRITMPQCVYIRGTSPMAEQIKYDSFKFNICFCRIVVNYASHKFEYLIIEWYIPVFIRPNIVWDLFIYHSY